MKFKSLKKLGTSILAISLASASIVIPVVHATSTYKLNSPVSVHVSADDAVKGTNSRGTYPAGTYSVYKETATAINITRKAGVPGAWIKKVAQPVATPKPATTQTVTTPKVTTTETQKPVTTTTTTTDSNKFEVKSNISGYVNAADAKAGRNPRTTLSKGSYFIYKTFDGMLNISTRQGVPGSWINPNSNTVNTTNAVAKQSTPVVSTPAPTSSKGQEIANYARRFVGGRYIYGGASPSGFDCSGLMYYVFRQMGITLPRTASAQARVGTPVSLNSLQPGDLVFFGSSASNISHVAVYSGNGKIIHALNPSWGIQENSLWGLRWNPQIQFARRVVK